MLVTFLAAALVTTADVQIDAAHPLRVIGDGFLGVNTATWDGALKSAQTEALLRALSLGALRFPGGSTADGYHWQTNTRDPQSRVDFTPYTSFDQFAALLSGSGARGIITVNAGSGTAAEAAAWVAHAPGIELWEIGNELYGGWETDSHSPAHDPEAYASSAALFLSAMRAANPNIRIGVPVTSLRESTQFPTWNSRMLARLQSLGARPDFVVLHRYEQEAGSEDDAALLAAPASWPREIAALRAQIPPPVDILCTELGSVASAPGRQSTSIVNALYLADSVGAALETEVRAVLWWDLHNEYDETTGGDFGIVSPDNQTKYPTFHAMKLASAFARAGDTVVSAISSSPLLAAHATKRRDGGVTVLIVNKDPHTPITATLRIGGAAVGTTARVRSYGVASPNIAESVLPYTGAFTFPPYSITLLELAAGGRRRAAGR